MLGGLATGGSRGAPRTGDAYVEHLQDWDLRLRKLPNAFTSPKLLHLVTPDNFAANAAAPSPYKTSCPSPANMASKTGAGMKIRISAPTPTPAAEPPAADVAQTPGGTTLKLKFGSSSKPTPAREQAPAPGIAPQKKEKRKYTRKPKPEDDGASAAPKKSKKRAREEEDDKPAKRPANSGSQRTSSIKINIPAPPAPSIAPAPTAPRPSIPKITLKTASQQPAISRVTLKAKGKPPVRPVGVGYDSEAEDIEVDPAIENQFILRMLPGEDCDYLRKAIEEKKIGIPVRHGGADVQMRFFDREGRRAMVIIQGRQYAAVLLDLPCVIEATKSWDKKSWFKSADVFQMLLVLGRVQGDEQAKSHPLPREVDQETWQYPHGLTPPMHYVRKRRFRKRVSYRTIEAVEEEVERLLEADEQAIAGGGSTEYTILDLDRLRDESQAHDEDEADAYGALQEQDGYYEEEEEDDEAMARLMEQELGGDEDDEPVIPVPESANANPHAPHVSTIPISNGLLPDPTATPSASAGTETDDDDDEDADGAVDEIDEDALAEQQELAQQREEIADLEREVHNAQQQLDRQTNPLLRQRLAAKVASLQSDLELKRASLGEGWDDA